MFSMLRLSKTMLTLSVMLMLIQSSTSPAAVPRLIAYQGRLTTSGGTPITGNKLTKFTLYNSASADIWNSGFINVSFTDGLFSVLLGESPQPGLPSSIWAADTSVMLGITVDTDPEISPRTRLATVAYAYQALQADSANAVVGDPYVNESGDVMTGDLGIDFVSGTGTEVSFTPSSTGAYLDLKDNDVTKVRLFSEADMGGLSLHDFGGDLTVQLSSGYSVGGLLSLKQEDGTNGVDLRGGTTSDGATLSMRNAGGLTTISLDADFTGDAAAEFPANSISATEILDGTIINADVSAGAQISASKISGTAATLGLSQTFTGATNTFDGSIVVNDSTFRANSSGIRIGDDTSPSTSTLVRISRNYNTASSRQGLYSDVFNEGIGTITAVEGIAEATTAGAGGTAYGGFFIGTSDAGLRFGVYAQGVSQDAAIATGTSYGVYGTAAEGLNAYGIYGVTTGSATNEYGGYFSGNAHCTGTLSKGAGAFKIDHPLDPENKYLLHSFVESPDMMNIYNGNASLDANGEAVVQLPNWFTALNKDFRYQLTAIGAPGPNLYIASEVSNNQFKIAGGQPLSRASWQVTGIRHDNYADANRIQVEIDKQPQERGAYMHPSAFGLGKERFVNYEQEKAAREAMSHTPDQTTKDSPR